MTKKKFRNSLLVMALSVACLSSAVSVCAEESGNGLVLNMNTSSVGEQFKPSISLKDYLANHGISENSDSTGEDAIVKNDSELENGFDNAVNNTEPMDEPNNQDLYLGSISVNLTDGKQGTSKSGIEFECIKVANVDKGEYVLLDMYKDTGVNLNTIENSAALEKAATALSSKGTGVVKTTDANGSLRFDIKEVGVYLLKAKDTEKYDTISPSLIAIPTYDEAKGEMCFDVTVSPKHTPKPDKPSKSAPQTGYENKAIFYVSLAGIFAVCALGIEIISKKVSKKKVKH